MGIEHMEDIIYIIRKDKTKYSQAIFLLKKKKKVFCAETQSSWYENWKTDSKFR